MEEVKTFNFDTGNNSLLAAILPSLQQRGIDTGMLMGMLNNNRGGGFFGSNGGFQDIIALIVIAAIFGNGNGGGIFGGGNNQNSTERQMLMSAIERNGVDIGQLSQTLNCSVGRVYDAIGQISTQICNLAGQQGLSFQQVINAVQAGNCAITNQIASCCCDLKQVINGVAVGMERGFSSIGFETQRQTCALEKSIADSTEKILASQRADLLGSSVPDEQHLALYVKDTCDDVDGGDGVVMRRWYASMVGSGEPVEWEDLLEDE